MNEEKMDFAGLKKWLKDRGMTFKLEGWSSCIPDTILIYKGNELLYEGEYHHTEDYINAVNAIRAKGIE